ncbi:DUF1674 domain-containing protein [Hirschia maritima]|uniref:DUF1674 domain-containing protein n=1 Tax=Hirschia maritima TaxID=1121961 RepID=UPI000361C81A|nr:DUF1674 domain-containing protein [Hirschia maritima]
MTQKNENSENSSSALQNEAVDGFISGAAPGKELSPAAQRALEEAAERRVASDAKNASEQKPEEWNGPRGEEPTRYGDWERKGITYDF